MQAKIIDTRAGQWNKVIWTKSKHLLTLKKIPYRTKILSLAASLYCLKKYTRDITQAYIQSHTKLERTVYIYAPV